MAGDLVFAIGRQFGSGGHEIGKMLAAQLKINFYDRELLRIASKESGISESLFEKFDETANNSYLYSLVTGIMPSNSLFLSNDDVMSNDKLFALQSKVIRDIAHRESCVLVGRASTYILKEERRVVRVFIHSDFDKRVERIQELHKMEKKEATDWVKKTDKKRAAYHNYYTSCSWEDLNNYDLCIDSGRLGIEDSVKIIKQFSESV